MDLFLLDNIHTQMTQVSNHLFNDSVPTLVKKQFSNVESFYYPRYSQSDGNSVTRI